MKAPNATAAQVLPAQQKRKASVLGTHKTNSLHTSTGACDQVAALTLDHVHHPQEGLPALQERMAGEWGAALQARMASVCTSQASWTRGTAPPQPPQKSHPAPCSAPPRDAWRRIGDCQVAKLGTSFVTAVRKLSSSVSRSGE